jgi:glycine cleavage system H protein
MGFRKDITMPDPHYLRYTSSHEWVYADNDIATIGITDHAQEELGDVALILLPEVGQVFQAEDKFGEVESIKAVSDLYTPVAGQVIEVNQQLHVHPEWINESPLDEGWMVRIKMTSPEEIGSLLTPAEYEQLVQES